VPDNAAWYLGPGQRWVPTPIDAVERYTMAADMADVHPGAMLSLGIFGISLIVAPLFVMDRAFSPQVALAAAVAVFWIVRRGWRRARRKPNDVILALAGGKLYALHAVCGLVRGWRVVDLIGTWEPGALDARATRLGELDMTPQGGPRLLLKPTHPSPEALRIAAAVDPQGA